MTNKLVSMLFYIFMLFPVTMSIVKSEGVQSLKIAKYGLPLWFLSSMFDFYEKRLLNMVLNFSKFANETKPTWGAKFA